jgi:hypothetical protein
MIRGNNGVRVGMADWLKEFAEYWKDAENRVKKADYVSEIQRVLNGKRTVDDIVSDLRGRVGLDLVNIKESESEEEKKTASADIPSSLQNDQNMVEFIISKIRNEPFTTFEAIKADLGYPPEFDDPEVEKFVQEVIKEERGDAEARPISYNIDNVDAEDNKYIDYDQRDTVNKI